MADTDKPQKYVENIFSVLSPLIDALEEAAKRDPLQGGEMQFLLRIIKHSAAKNIGSLGPRYGLKSQLGNFSEYSDRKKEIWKNLNGNGFGSFQQKKVGILRNEHIFEMVASIKNRGSLFTVAERARIDGVNVDNLWGKKEGRTRPRLRQAALTLFGLQVSMGGNNVRIFSDKSEAPCGLDKLVFVFELVETARGFTLIAENAVEFCQLRDLWDIGDTLCEAQPSRSNCWTIVDIILTGAHAPSVATSTAEKVKKLGIDKG